jgi:hypothetical protein
MVRLIAKNCGFAPAALRRERVVEMVRLIAKNCGFAPAALRREVWSKVQVSKIVNAGEALQILWVRRPCRVR